MGHLAVQIAKACGAHVIATASAAKHDLLAELGVDEPVDYRSRQFEEVVEPVDVVYDLIGGDVAVRSLDVLRPDGIRSACRPARRPRRWRRAAHAVCGPPGCWWSPTATASRNSPPWSTAERCGVLSGKTFPLARAADAHRRRAGLQSREDRARDDLTHQRTSGRPSPFMSARDARAR